MGGDEAHSRSVGRGGCDEWRRQWHMAREEAMTKCVAVEVLLAERVRSQCGSCFYGQDISAIDAAWSVALWWCFWCVRSQFERKREL